MTNFYSERKDGKPFPLHPTRHYGTNSLLLFEIELLVKAIVNL